MTEKVLIAFVPVLHRGYRMLFERHSDARVLYLLGESWTEDFPHLAKEIRALDPLQAKTAIESWEIFGEVQILEKTETDQVLALAGEIVMPDEDIMREIGEKYASGKTITFDSIFLRWDKHNTVAEKPVSPDISISADAFDQEMMILSEEEAKRSSDFWRHVGAVIVKDGKIVLSTHNTHVPSEHTPYVNGDPRNNFHKGVHLELSTSLHAEAGVIAEAARRGIALEGASLYSSTFPCPPCAKQVAYSGIKKIYYRTGYGVLDGEDILKSQGVQIIFVADK